MPEPTPNIIAYLAFLLCVPIILYLFSRHPPPLACAISIIGSAMFLPEVMSFDPPVLPPLGKVAIPAFGALIGAWFWGRDLLLRARPFRGVDLLFVGILLGTVGTVMTNGDNIPYENGVMEALTPYDIFASGLRDFLEIYTPFFLGRALFTTRRDLYTFATVMAAGGLIYSVCVMLEVRLSPQLHNWVYGYFQHRFDQTYRFGGYRPMNFMTHGLNNARFMLGTLLCCVALARANRKIWNRSTGRFSWWLGFTVLLCRSAGAWILGAIALIVTYFTTIKGQIRLATILSGFVLLYPVLRAGNYVPVDDVLAWAEENLGADRASSLEDRFEQEELLLGKMRERGTFGWGPGIRYNVWDKAEGSMATIDGEWMHTFGRGGWFRFVGIFGLYLAPIWAARRSIKSLRESDARLVATLTVMMAVWAFDNIPNSCGTLPQLFMAGVVYGGTRGIAAQTAAENRKRAAEDARARRAAASGGSAVGQGTG